MWTKFYNDRQYIKIQIMILLYCGIGVLLFISVFKLGSRRQRMKDQKELDQHVENIKKTMYSLISFGMEKGFPFNDDSDTCLEDIKTLHEKDHLLLSLRKALENEDYEKASIIRDKIINYDRNNN